MSNEAGLCRANGHDWDEIQCEIFVWEIEQSKYGEMCWHGYEKNPIAAGMSSSKLQCVQEKIDEAL